MEYLAPPSSIQIGVAQDFHPLQLSRAAQLIGQGSVDFRISADGELDPMKSPVSLRFHRTHGTVLLNQYPVDFRHGLLQILAHYLITHDGGAMTEFIF